MPVERAEQFGRVAVVMGGSSAEREVSLDGGQQVLAALLERGVDAVAIDGVPELLTRIQQGGIDRVFNLLHGRGGEDGTLQGALRSLDVPITGSDVLGSALSMNKALSKAVWAQLGLLTAPFRLLRGDEDPAPLADQVGYPLVVKPVSEGSSVGISMVRRPAGLADAVARARRHEDQVLLESFVAGEEYTVAVLQGRSLPVVRIRPSREFYDYEAKYQDDTTQYFCPSGLDESIEADLRRTGLAAFQALSCSGWGRVDFIRTGAGEAFLLEANTTPGMTSHSLVPKSAAAAGIDFSSLCWRILETSFPEENP